MQKHKTNILDLSQRVVTFNPEFARMVGLNEAILFNQLYYWSSRTHRTDGWFYKTKEELTEETSLSRFQQDQARGKLKSLGLIETKVKRANGKPTIHYRVAKQKATNLLYESLETRDSEARESRECITETTQEITTENLQKAIGPSKEELRKHFTRFWQAYPNKKGKEAAWRSWLKLKPDEAFTERIISKVEDYTTTLQWNRERGKFIPYPATFLNHGRYDDDITHEPRSQGNDETLTL